MEKQRGEPAQGGPGGVADIHGEPGGGRFSRGKHTRRGDRDGARGCGGGEPAALPRRVRGYHRKAIASAVLEFFRVQSAQQQGGSLAKKQRARREAVAGSRCYPRCTFLNKLLLVPLDFPALAHNDTHYRIRAPRSLTTTHTTAYAPCCP